MALAELRMCCPHRRGRRADGADRGGVDCFDEPLRAVVLKERYGGRALAIWMGSADAFSLLRHNLGIGETRPVAASVTAAPLDATGARVEHVGITDVRENVCHAVIQLRLDGRVAMVDARPSDA